MGRDLARGPGRDHRAVGAPFARRVGEAWNAADDLGEEAAAAGGMEVVDAPAEVADAIRARAEELEAAWAATLGEGYDGEAALEAFRGMTGMTP